MIWTALDFSSPWNWLIVLGVFAVLGIMVFKFSFDAYYRRYFYGKALKLAFWRTVGWLVLSGVSFVIVFWPLSILFPKSSWWAYLIGWTVWGILSETVVAAGVHILDAFLEK